jgi:hypothetical protein
MRQTQDASGTSDPECVNVPSRNPQDVNTLEPLISVRTGSAIVTGMVLRIRNADGPSDKPHAFVSHQFSKTGVIWQTMPKIAQIINVIKILMASPKQNVDGLMNRTRVFALQRRRRIALVQPLRANAYRGSATPTAMAT